MPGLSPASTGEPPSEKRQATNRLRDERISGGFANWPSFMIASSLDLSCRMETFASGSPSTRSRSASQPSRISPRSLHQGRAGPVDHRHPGGGEAARAAPDARDPVALYQQLPWYGCAPVASIMRTFVKRTFAMSVSQLDPGV